MDIFTQAYLNKAGYPAAGRRCLIDIDEIENNIPQLKQRVLATLVERLGFTIIDKDRAHIAAAVPNPQPQYVRGVWSGEPDARVDCSLFVQQRFAAIGIGLYRTSSRQYDHPLGYEVSGLGHVRLFDAIFTSGPYAYPNGVGHVCLAISNTHVIHATGDGQQPVVRIEPIRQLLKRYTLIGIRRYLHGQRLVTVEAPPAWEDAPESSRAIQEDLYRHVQGHPEFLPSAIGSQQTA